MKKFNILRIGNFPTTKYNTVGMHAYYANFCKQFRVLQISSKVEGNPIKIPKNVVLKRVPLLLKPRNRNNNLLKLFCFDISRLVSVLYFNFVCILFLIRNKIDIVHIHSPMYLLCVFFAKIFGLRTFITYHGGDLKAVKESLILKLLSKNIDGVFTLSPNFKKDLRKIHKTKIYEVYNGVDTNIFFDEKRKREKIILMVGSFKKQKGHTYLINAFEKFSKVNKNYRIIFVGEGPEKNNILYQTEKLKLNEKVLFLNYMNSKKLNKLYNRSEIFVLPSISEGFPKVLLEALSGGCKIITTKIDGNKKIFGSNYKFYIKTKDSKSIFEALKKIVKTNKTFFSNQKKEILKKYKWKNVHQNYLDVYNN